MKGYCEYNAHETIEPVDQEIDAVPICPACLIAKQVDNAIDTGMEQSRTWSLTDPRGPTA